MGNLMKREELDEILRRHKLWLEDDPEGVRANLEGAMLKGANLEGANLKGAMLKGANLEGANLTDAKMTDANLTGANLTDANLEGANLTDAKMTGAKIDYCSWPLWCGSLGAHVDDRIAIQLLYHTLSVVSHSPDVSEDVRRALLTPELVGVANRFHHVHECGMIEAYEGKDKDAGSGC